MKAFTQNDVHRGRYIYTSDAHIDLIYDPLSWQKKGLHKTRLGYGSKLTSPYKIHFEGKMRRLYTTHFSNASSTWFEFQGKRIFVH